MLREHRHANLANSIQLNNLLGWLRDYAARRINSQLIDERRTIAPHIVLDMGNQGLLGMQIPKTFGGRLELSNFELLRVQRQLGAIDLTLAFFVGLNNGLGVRPIQRFAQAHLKERYLPDLAAGRILGAFAISEDGAGSNPLALEATAQRGPDGFRVSGTKLWCGSASWAGVVSVFAKHVDNNGCSVGHIGLCVDASQLGMRVGAEALTMGLRGMVQNTVHFEDALIAPERVLGSQFAGLSVASDVMGFGRLGIAATAVGGLWRALQLMVRYSKRRQINTGLLYSHGHTQRVINNTLRAATLLGGFVDNIGYALDCNASIPADLHAAAKLLTSEALWEGVDAAMQMLGGRGYCENNGASQLLRDARITRLFEGPSETLASFLGQRLWQSKGTHLTQYFIHCGAAGQNASWQLTHLLNRIAQCVQVKKTTELEHSAMLVPLGYAVAWQLLTASSDTNGLVEVKWLEEQFEKASRGVFSALISTALPDAAELECEVAFHIGDIEQSAASMDCLPDHYLQRTVST
jgi:alkylation response protein AidB-like acyl-CoA dehydrogenase